MRFLFLFFCGFFFFRMDCLLYTAKQAYIYYLIDHLHNQREREISRSISREHRAQFKVRPKPTQFRTSRNHPPLLFSFSFFPSLHHLTPYTTTKPNSDNPSSPNPNSTPQTYNFSPNTSHYPHYSNTSLPPPTPAISTEAAQV